MITLTMFMFAAAVAYGVAFSEPIVEFGFLILEVVVIHLYLASAALATVAWMLASTRLKSESISAHAMGSARVRVAARTYFSRPRSFGQARVFLLLILSPGRVAVCI